MADALALYRYLTAHGVQIEGEVRTADDGSRWFKTKDPEGNTVGFSEAHHPAGMAANAHPIATRITWNAEREVMRHAEFIRIHMVSRHI